MMAEEQAGELLRRAFQDKDAAAANELLAYCIEKQAKITQSLTTLQKVLDGFGRFYQLDNKATKGAEE